jgi:hypothetical protein
MRKLIALISASLLAAVAWVLLAQAASEAAPATDLKAAKSATARFRSVAAAEKAGYVRASPCIAARGGAEGIHYVNSRLAQNPALDVRRPELLIYEPTSNGELRLGAVEYFKADADGKLSTSRDRPRLFGRPFQGPMKGHAPGQPVHYDLHVWLWKKNPRGIFVPFNPAASCAHAKLEDELGRAKKATARYQSLAEAEKDGYVPLSPCVMLPAGAEGIHYGKPALLGDANVAIEQPELLLYEPKADGSGLTLVGVEYFKADADQNPATADDRPTLFGRSFDGPMAGHAPGQPVHYDLHVWIWRANPKGVLAPGNPKVACQ